MEPHREKQKLSISKVEQKPKRFRIVKLEERIAPSNKAGNGTHHCPRTYGCSWGCTVGCATMTCPYPIAPCV